LTVQLGSFLRNVLLFKATGGASTNARGGSDTAATGTAPDALLEMLAKGRGSGADATDVPDRESFGVLLRQPNANAASCSATYLCLCQLNAIFFHLVE